MSKKVPKTPKEAIERAQSAADRREAEIERAADKMDAVVQVEGPKARQRLADASHPGKRERR